MTKRILVAGIGNIFLGDDAFGVEVVRELSKLSVPETVEIRDFGIRSYDLAYALMDSYQEILLVDATARGQPPGTLYLMELDPGEAGEVNAVDGHSLSPAHALQMAKAMGGVAARVHLLGCEPGNLDCDQIGLSPCVQACIPQAVAMVQEMISQILGLQNVGKETTTLH